MSDNKILVIDNEDYYLNFETPIPLDIPHYRDINYLSVINDSLNILKDGKYEFNIKFNVEKTSGYRSTYFSFVMVKNDNYNEENININLVRDLINGNNLSFYLVKVSGNRDINQIIRLKKISSQLLFLNYDFF